MLKTTFLLFMGSLVISTNVVANEIDSQTQGLLLVKSAFAPQADTYTVFSQVTPWPDDLNVTIDNQWQFKFHSSKAIHLTKLTLSIDGQSISNHLNLQLHPKVTSPYFFSEVNLQQVVQSLTSGYKFIGVYKHVSADDFYGFSTYRYKKLQVTVAWSDVNKNYSQSTTNFMLVMAK